MDRVDEVEEKIRDRYRDVELAAREGTILIGHDRAVVDVFKVDHRIGVDRDSMVGGHPVPAGWSVFDDDGTRLSLEQHPGLRAIGGSDVVTQTLTYESPTGDTFRLRFIAYPLDDDPRVAVDVVVIDEQRRRETRKLLETQESRFRTMTEMLPVAVYEATATGEISYVNPKFTEISGLTAATAPDLPMLEIVHPDDLVGVMNATTNALSENHYHSQYRLVHVDGSSRWVTSRMSLLVDEDGKMAGFTGAIEDIDELTRSERESARLASIVEAAGDSIAVIEDNRYSYLNASARRLLLRTDPSFEIDFQKHIFREQFREHFLSTTRTPLLTTGSWSGEVRFTDAHGEPVDLSLVLDADVENGWVTRCVIIARDIAEQKRREGRLADEALRDPLTRLWNRHGLDAAVADMVPSEHIHVCYVDVDHFKGVNDSAGHVVGDAVLVEATARLQRAAGPRSTVARVGGDEFVVVVPGAEGSDLGLRLVQAVGSSPIAAGSGSTTVTVSVGAASGPAGRFETICAAADSALYRAKASGRDTWERSS